MTDGRPGDRPAAGKRMIGGLPPGADVYAAQAGWPCAAGAGSARELQKFDTLGVTLAREPKQLGTFTSVSLTDAAGQQGPLGRWRHYKRVMTSTETTQGTVEGEPGALTGGGRAFSVTVR